MISTRALVWFVVCALGACGGGKKPAPASVGTGSDEDGGDEMDAARRDAGRAASKDAGGSGGQPSTPTDAGTKLPDAGAGGRRDSGTSTVPGDTTDDPDAGPHCTNRGCRALGDECNVGRCDAQSGECVIEPKPDGTACGSQALDNCSAKDTCKAGACMANDAAENTPCGDQGKDCHYDDRCDGAGHCVDKGLWAENEACGDQTTNTACDHRDSCSGEGVCLPNYAAVDTVCADENDACKYPDLCDGLGQCIDSGDKPQPCP